jgi:hypothetical protein
MWWLMSGVAAALPLAIFGLLAAFDRTRPIAAWLWRVLMFLFGWFVGLAVAAPMQTTDEDLQTRMALAMGVFLFLNLAVLAAFLAVGVVLLAVPRTRKVGRQFLLSLLLVPVGALMAWYISRRVIPEWHEVRAPTGSDTISWAKPPDRGEAGGDRSGKDS